jgi:hypothetical protein
MDASLGVGHGLFSAEVVNVGGGDERGASSHGAGDRLSSADDDLERVGAATTVDDGTSNGMTDFSFTNGFFSTLVVLLFLPLPTPAGVCHILPPRDGPETNPMAPLPPPV